MRKRIYKNLEELEKLDAAVWQARAYRNRPSCVEVFRELLSRHAIEPLAAESLAETVARASGISALQLKDLLWEREHSIGP